MKGNNNIKASPLTYDVTGDIMGDKCVEYYIEGIKIKVIREYVQTTSNLVDKLIDVFLKQQEQEDLTCQVA